MIRGVVFFLGPGFLEVSGHAAGPVGRSVMIWIQVRDVHAKHARLAAAGVPIVRAPATEPWGLIEMWIQDPDGIRIVLVEVPPITLCAVTRDRRLRHDDVTYA
jgi:predicted enzyme related to lactoylglutathione lyase